MHVLLRYLFLLFFFGGGGGSACRGQQISVSPHEAMFVASIRSGLSVRVVDGLGGMMVEVMLDSDSSVSLVMQARYCQTLQRNNAIRQS